MILIGMCSGGQIQALTVLSLMDLLGAAGDNAAFSMQIGGYKPHGMNNLVKDAQQIRATHLLNIDSDMIFPPDALQRLLEADKDIVGVNYRQRGNHLDQDYPTSTIKFEEGGVPVSKLEQDFPKELFECAAVGLGLTLINMRVFDKLPFPWYRTSESWDVHSTEDIVFCQDARKKGFSVWCDPSISMKHIGQYLY